MLQKNENFDMIKVPENVEVRVRTILRHCLTLFKISEPTNTIPHGSSVVKKSMSKSVSKYRLYPNLCSKNAYPW